MEFPSPDLPPAAPPAPLLAPASNPTPNYAPTFNHPPYSEMITAAILALKEKEGSSRQAIAKYIEQEFKNLPPGHASLLTQQLKRMKTQGELVMVKHSYMLPRSDVFSPPTSNTSPAPITGVATSEVSDGPKRRPGRPRKAQTQSEVQVQPNGGVMEPPEVYLSVGQADGLQTSGPSFVGPSTDAPMYTQIVGPVTTVTPFDPIGAVPTVVPIGQPIGHVDGMRAKRRPGRPSKVKSLGVETESVGAEPVGPVVQPPELGKRRPGRPAKVNNGSVAVGPVGNTLGKRARGRPSKAMSVLMGNSVAKKGRGRPPRAAGSVIAQRRKGRPKKGVSYTVRAGGRPRGRPPKNVSVNGLGAGVLSMKRAGRPPKMGVPKKLRKLSGKPLGRPKKNASVGDIIALAEQQQLLAYEELKGRVEHFQTRIKQAVSVVRPYLNSETSVIAVEALQELEELASMNITTPVQGAPVTADQSAPVAAQSEPEPAVQGQEQLLPQN